MQKSEKKKAHWQNVLEAKRKKRKLKKLEKRERDRNSAVGKMVSLDFSSSIPSYSSYNKRLTQLLLVFDQVL